MDDFPTNPLNIPRPVTCKSISFLEEIKPLI